MVTPAKKLIELTKDNKKILVTIFEGGQISSCVQDEHKQYCETCQCDDETCEEWIEHLKGKGYSATEVKLGELEMEESLPKFLEERERDIMPAVEPSAEAEE